MKTKNIIIIVCCIIAVAFTLGATGVVKVKSAAIEENHDSDRLIGVLITREYLDLFDSDRFLSDNINGGEISRSESAEYQGRLYADLVETIHTNDETGEAVKSREYVFNGIDGIRFFAPYIRDESGSYWSTTTDEGITDGTTHFQSTDDGESVTLKGTIFVAPNSNLSHFYFNPVYQTSNGEVYAVSGDGIILGGESASGDSWSQKITENRTETYGDTNTTSGTEVEVTVCVIEKPTGIALLQFDSNHELLKKEDLTKGNLPEHIDALPDVQYMIVETSSSEGGISRSLFQREDGFIYAFYCRDDGILIKHECEINWND